MDFRLGIIVGFVSIGLITAGAIGLIVVGNMKLGIVVLVGAGLLVWLLVAERRLLNRMRDRRSPP